MSSELSDEATEQALFCVNELIDRRNRDGVPLESWMPGLAKLFDVASLTCGMSGRGHEEGCAAGDSAIETSTLDSEHLVSDLVGSREAADILGLSTRQVRRRASELGVEEIGGRKVFRRSAVIDFKEHRNGRAS